MHAQGCSKVANVGLTRPGFEPEVTVSAVWSLLNNWRTMHFMKLFSYYPSQLLTEPYALRIWKNERRLSRRQVACISAYVHSRLCVCSTVEDSTWLIILSLCHVYFTLRSSRKLLEWRVRGGVKTQRCEHHSSDSKHIFCETQMNCVPDNQTKTALAR
jgi:hypothetical protein